MHLILASLGISSSFPITLHSLGCTICAFVPLPASQTSLSHFCLIVGARSSSHPLVLSSFHNLPIWVVHWWRRASWCWSWWLMFYSVYDGIRFNQCIIIRVFVIVSECIRLWLIMDDISLFIICWHVDTALLSSGRTLLLLVSTFSQGS